MSFEDLRKGKPTRSSKCSYCGKVDRAGKVEIVIKDKDTKTVTSKGIGACEKCAIERYKAAETAITP